MSRRIGKSSAPVPAANEAPAPKLELKELPPSPRRVVPAMRPVPRVRLVRRAARARVPVAWEVYVLGACYAVDAVECVTANRLFLAFVFALLCVGLLTRSMLAWWMLVVVGVGLAAIPMVGILFVSGRAQAVLLVAALFLLIQPGLLILCRWRGAY
ncbi:MAG: hypothetical protein HYY16_13660 [Planctomycetes bacterium]|nr:hypothetical protein [Planctomycetota bacterium]